ncbi:MAG: hypothetical protein N3A72_01990 [bacterium]|nr:hypothetical protein [bacterium]
MAALEKLDWIPKTEKEQIYSMICKRDVQNLIDNWELTKRILIQDIETSDIRKIENGIYSFICIGRAEIIHYLVTVLYAKGNNDIAATYISCGNKTLAKVGYNWLKKQRYKTISSAGKYGVSWGRWMFPPDPVVTP